MSTPSLDIELRVLMTELISASLHSYGTIQHDMLKPANLKLFFNLAKLIM